MKSIFFRVVKILTIFMTLLFSIFSMSGQQDEEFMEKMWKKLLKEYPVHKNSTELEYINSFPTDKDEVNEIYLRQARYFDLNEKGEVFISNNRANNILKFDSEGKCISSIGREGQGPTELLNQGNLRIFNGNSLIVKDRGNSRFQVYSFDGKHLYGFRISKLYWDFAITKDERIFIAPNIPKKDDKLIDVLDSKGVLLYSFGKGKSYNYNRSQVNNPALTYGAYDTNASFACPTSSEPTSSTDLRPQNCGGVLNSTSIAIKDNELYVVFKFLPFLRRYSISGELLSENKISYTIFQMKEKRNRKNISISHKSNVGYLNIISSARMFNGKIYILSTHPRLEIHEIDEKGEIIKTYYKTIKRNYYVTDFALKISGDFLLFYVLQFHPENKMDVYKAKL